MPILNRVNSQWFIVHRNAKTIDYRLSTIDWCQRRRGFTLIELLIVITISAMVMGLTTASFLTFERNQKLKNATATLKSDLRFTQSKAATGDKSTNPNCTTGGRTLIGWYILIGAGSSSYTINSDCKASGGQEFVQVYKTVSLASGVTVDEKTGENFDCDAILVTPNVLFQPLTLGATFHRGSLTPPFYVLGSSPPAYTAQIADCVGKDLKIVLKEQQSGARWKVTVKSSGDINDAKM